MYIYLYFYIYIYIYIYMYTYICVFTCIHMYVYVYVYICIHTHTWWMGAVPTQFMIQVKGSIFWFAVALCCSASQCVAALCSVFRENMHDLICSFIVLQWMVCCSVLHCDAMRRSRIWFAVTYVAVCCSVKIVMQFFTMCYSRGCVAMCYSVQQRRDPWINLLFLCVQWMICCSVLLRDAVKRSMIWFAVTCVAVCCSVKIVMQYFALLTVTVVLQCVKVCCKEEIQYLICCSARCSVTGVLQCVAVEKSMIRFAVAVCCSGKIQHVAVWRMCSSVFAVEKSMIRCAVMRAAAQSSVKSVLHWNNQWFGLLLQCVAMSHGLLRWGCCHMKYSFHRLYAKNGEFLYYNSINRAVLYPGKHTATHCNTPQHTATHRNTPQHMKCIHSIHYTCVLLYSTWNLNIYDSNLRWIHSMIVISRLCTQHL